MKKTTLVGAALIAGMFSVGANAEGIYGSAQVAMTNIDSDGGADYDSGYSLVINGGMGLEEMIDFEGISVEVELTKSLVSPELTFQGGKAEVSHWSVGGYAAYTYPINDEIGIKGKLGFTHIASSSTATGFPDEDDSDQGISFGVAVTYAINDEMSAILEYSRTNLEDQGVDSSMSHFGVGVSMPFDM